MAKLIDLTGQTFDKLTVIEKAPSRSRHVYWKCKCECGNICEVSGESLRRQQPHNCGCVIKNKKIAKEKEKESKKNWLIGKRFGKLVVEERTDKRINNSVVWKCKCDCGNYKEVPTHLLTGDGGHTKSCGCLSLSTHLIDITGQKFGKLTALYFIPKTGKWHCKCDCGNECDVDGYCLRNLYTQSCGCINYSIGELNIKNILEQNKISYKKEFCSDDLKNQKTNKPYRFDFAIFKDNDIIRLIEFDGEQHFSDKSGLWNSEDSLSDIQRRDQEKNKWAKEHNIPLIRIPFWERNNITLEMIMGDKYLI